MAEPEPFAQEEGGMEIPEREPTKDPALDGSEPNSPQQTDTVGKVVDPTAILPEPSIPAWAWILLAIAAIVFFGFLWLKKKGPQENGVNLSPFVWSGAIVFGVLVLTALFPVVREATDPLLARMEPDVDVWVLRPLDDGTVDLFEEKMKPSRLKASGFWFPKNPTGVEPFLGMKQIKSRDLLYTDQAYRRLNNFCRSIGREACTEVERFYLGYTTATPFLTFSPVREQIVMECLNPDGTLTGRGSLYDMYDPNQVRTLAKLVLQSMANLNEGDIQRYNMEANEMDRVKIVAKRPLQITYRDMARVVNQDIDLIQALALLGFRNRVQKKEIPIVLDPSGSFTLKSYVDRKRGVISKVKAC